MILKNQLMKLFTLPREMTDFLCYLSKVMTNLHLTHNDDVCRLSFPERESQTLASIHIQLDVSIIMISFFLLQFRATGATFNNSHWACNVSRDMVTCVVGIVASFTYLSYKNRLSYILICKLNHVCLCCRTFNRHVVGKWRKVTKSIFDKWKHWNF